jgi:hypothetical protein
LRELENASRTGSPSPGPGLSRRAVLASSAGTAAALVAIVLILTTGRTAQARSVVNEAPAAAERSGSVRFQSVLTTAVGGHRGTGITEQGAIDFTTGAFVTTLRFGNASDFVERRSVGRVLYTAQRRLRPGSGPARIHWAATPLQRGTRGVLAWESDAFTDPPSVFRALAGIRAPVKQVGHENIDGVPSTRYHLRSNLAFFLGPSAGYVQNPLAYRRVRADLDVWIDARGRPLRVLETFTGPSSSGRTVMTTVVRFTGYGRPVSVMAPASADIRSSKGSAPPNPLAADPGASLARRLFFQPSGG